MIKENGIRASQVEFETIACPNCDHEEYQIVYAFADKFGSYAIVRCGRCQFSYLNPRPTHSTIGIYYEAAHYTPFLSSTKDTSFFEQVYSAVRKYSVRWKRKMVEHFKQGKSVLDIGCGTGEFLFEMKSHGWAASGLEPSKEASKFACEAYQLNIQTGFIDESLKSILGPFDVITMWHVLEHVHTPLKALAIVRELLSDDGLLLIAVPNISSFDAGVYKKDWIALDVPRHLLHFTPETLNSMLGKAGLEIIDQHQMPLDTIFNCLMSEKKIMDRNPWYTTPFHLIRLAGSILLSWATGFHENRGSSVMYYIQKTKR